MAEGILVVTGDGCIAVYNRPAEELLGLEPDTLAVGRPLVDAVRCPALVDFVARLRTTAASPVLDEAVIQARERVVRASATIVSPPGTPLTILILLHDAREAARLQSMRRDFVANVSHEVRTPLAAIRGCSATLLAGALDDQARARRFVEIIEQHAVRLSQLVDDLGQLADLEEGRAELHRRPIAIRPCIEMAVNLCRDRAVGGGVSIEWAVNADTPALDADRDLLDQALLRLIDNALRYTPHRGRITIRAGVDRLPDDAGGPWVCLVVADTGIGIAPEELPRLSERLYRPDKARSRELGGSGLGLAVVKHIVQAHGGSMRITSALQEGTTVMLLWPASAERGHPAPAG